MKALPPLLLLGCIALSLAPSHAAPPTTDQPSATETTRAYTDGGTTTSTWQTSTVYPAFSNRDPYYNSLNRGFASDIYGTVTTQHRPIYFPPSAPALGEPIPTKNVRLNLDKFSPPTVLADYVYEPFYAPLSTLLFTENLDRHRRQKLDAFRAARTAALQELQDKLSSLENADTDTRQRELAAFASLQTPKLAELEKTAEEMRDNFVNGGFFQDSVDWNETRHWRLGDNTRWESTADEIKVVGAAVFFQDNLSPAQRRLLRELTMELMDSLEAPGTEIALTTPGPFFYFAPASARIRLPLDLPAELAAKIHDYQALKADLKKELRDVLYRTDRSFNFKRNNAIKALAEQQAPRFAQLDQLAEEIRVGLAPLPNPASPPALPLPKELVKRVSAYLAAKSDWQRAMQARLDEVRAAFPEDRVEFLRQSDGLSIQIVANRRSTREADARRATAQAALETFNREQNKRYWSLVHDKESIRADTLQVAGTLSGRSTNKPIEVLLAEFTYAFGLQERWDRYHDYAIAVLQPGLSPEQRRLLFGAALQKFDLPLNSQN